MSNHAKNIKSTRSKFENLSNYNYIMPVPLTNSIDIKTNAVSIYDADTIRIISDTSS